MTSDDAGNIYASTAGMIYKSSDQGRTWSSFTVNVPGTPGQYVCQVYVKGSTYYIVGRATPSVNDFTGSTNNVVAYSTDLTNWTNFVVGAGYAAQCVKKDDVLYIPGYDDIYVVNMIDQTNIRYVLNNVNTVHGNYYPLGYNICAGETHAFSIGTFTNVLPALLYSMPWSQVPYGFDTAWNGTPENIGFTPINGVEVRAYNPGHGKIFATLCANTPYGGWGNQTMHLSYLLSSGGVDDTVWHACDISSTAVTVTNQSGILPVWSPSHSKYLGILTYDDNPAGTRVIQSADGITWINDATIPGVTFGQVSGAVPGYYSP